MIKIFTHENRLIVFNIKNLLQGEGIETVVVNEFAAGGVGDLGAFDTWPELWLEDDTRQAQAREIVQAVLNGNATGTWFCRGCHEQNENPFRICWNCGHSYE